VSGVLCADRSPHEIAEALVRGVELPEERRRAILDQARRVARAEFHPERAASDLLDMYVRAIELTRGAAAPPDGSAAPRPPTRPVGRRERVDEPFEVPASHVRLRGTLRYRVEPTARHWHGVDVLLGTHQRRAAGRLELTVLSPQGNVVRTAHADLEAAGDNEWLRFDFAPVANAAGGVFVLRLRLRRADRATRLSVYDRDPAAGALAQRVARRLHLAGVRDSLYGRLRYAIEE
jgi:hypothetical protein